MKSYQVILLIAGVVLSRSAHLGSRTYQHLYDDEFHHQDSISSSSSSSSQQHQHRHHQSPSASSSYVDQDYYDYEDEEEERLGEGEEGVEEEYVEEEGEEEEEVEPPVEVNYDDGDEQQPPREFPHHAYDDEVTSLSAPTTDPLDDARQIAVLNIMDRILGALGPPFVKELPKPPTNDTLATVPTPINIYDSEPCPYKYKRCTSETTFPSCNIPHNTDPDAWSMGFNLYFNLSADFSKLDIISATLRLYKNMSIPLRYPKPLLIKAYAYTRKLTWRRPRTMLVAEISVSSDYIGLVTLPVEKIVKRWRKPRTNHGILVTVTDADTIPWNASEIFVMMSCSSGNKSLIPLPFEVQTDEVGQRYPALNVRQGSPVDEFPVGNVALLTPSPRPAFQTEVDNRYIQSDDPYVYDDEYDIPKSPSQGHVFQENPSVTLLNNYPYGVGENPIHPHYNHPFNAENHGTRLPHNYPHGTDMAQGVTQENGHALQNNPEHNAVGSSGHRSTYTHGVVHHGSPASHLSTNQATTHHHSNKAHYGNDVSHSRSREHHPAQGTAEHHHSGRVYTIQPTVEDGIQSQNSEEQIYFEDLVKQRESIPSTEHSRPHRQRDSGNTKERRHRRKHHNQHSRRAQVEGRHTTGDAEPAASL